MSIDDPRYPPTTWTVPGQPELVIGNIGERCALGFSGKITRQPVVVEQGRTIALTIPEQSLFHVNREPAQLDIPTLVANPPDAGRQQEYLLFK